VTAAGNTSSSLVGARLTGFLCLIAAAVWYVGGASPLRLSLMPEWLIVGAAAPLYILGTGLFGRWARRYPAARRFTSTLDMLLVGLLCAVSIALIVRGHRWYLGTIIFAQTLLVCDLLARRHAERSRAFAWAVAGVLSVSWIFAAGFTFTQLDSLLFSFSPVSPFFVVTFCLTLALITYDALPSNAETARKTHPLRIVGLAATVLAFLELALRTDGAALDWLPFHQSFFVDPVGFLRQGHWLLWDVPTQYGFLQIVAIAMVPLRSAWESFYVVTALWTTVAATLLFVLLRERRNGWIGYASSFLICVAIYFGGLAQRWPFGYRFYPQVGLRFFPLLAVLFIIYLELRKRDDPVARARIRMLGHLAWLVAALWAFESAVWTTLAWATYIYLDAVAHEVQKKVPVWSAMLFATRALIPVAVFGVVGIGLVDGYYLANLHHLPDWVAFIEFSGIYSSNPAQIEVLPLRSAWEILLSLSVLGWAAIVLLQRRRFESFAVIGAAWIAVWSTSVYFAGEPFENHVAATLQVQAFAWGLLLAVQAREGLVRGSGTLARLAMLPLWIIVVASFVGQPDEWIHARMPFFNGYHLDIAQDYPPISGELLELLARAGIGPDDRVVLPASAGWNKLDNGILMPFMRGADGRNRELPSWFLTSPIGEHNTLFSLSAQRRTVFTSRFVDILKEGGWYVTYHRHAVCESLWPAFRTARTIASGNYEAAYCSLGSRAVPASP
jgi:hypothetical protein